MPPADISLAVPAAPSLAGSGRGHRPHRHHLGRRLDATARRLVCNRVRPGPRSTTGLLRLAAPRLGRRRVHPTHSPHWNTVHPGAGYRSAAGAPTHRHPAGRGDLQGVRQAPRPRVPVLRGDLPGRRLPAAACRTRWRQRHPGHRRPAPCCIPHLHRAVVRHRAHPQRQTAQLHQPQALRLPTRTVPCPPRHRRVRARHPGRLLDTP